MTVYIHIEVYARYAIGMQKVCIDNADYQRSVPVHGSIGTLRDWRREWIADGADFQQRLVACCALQWLGGSYLALLSVVGDRTDIGVCSRVMASDTERHCQFMCLLLSYCPPCSTNHRTMVCELLRVVELGLSGVYLPYLMSVCIRYLFVLLN